MDDLKNQVKAAQHGTAPFDWMRDRADAVLRSSYQGGVTSVIRDVMLLRF